MGIDFNYRSCSYRYISKPKIFRLEWLVVTGQDNIYYSLPLPLPSRGGSGGVVLPQNVFVSFSGGLFRYV